MRDHDYDRKAEYYDVLDGSFIPYDAAAKRISDTLKLKKAHILDMAAGTGSFTVALKKLGHKVEGMDLSPGMIKVAKRKAPQIKFSKHDMRKPLKGQYDLITCMFNAVGHLTPMELEQTLQAFHNRTRYVVFDIFNYDFMDKNFREYPFIDRVHEEDGLKIARFNSNTLDRKRHVMRINQETFYQHQGRPVVKDAEGWDMQIYTVTEVKHVLERNGYRVLKFYGGFDKRKGMSEFTKDSTSIIAFAESR
jgi:SAM-dependent methyltransferase